MLHSLPARAVQNIVLRKISTTGAFPSPIAAAVLNELHDKHLSN